MTRLVIYDSKMLSKSYLKVSRISLAYSNVGYFENYVSLIRKM
jgi:hypothetical protein